MKNKRTQVKDISGGQIVLYQNQMEVRLVKDTVWLSLNQMADLFERDKSVISRHLFNIYQINELDRKSTVAFFATVQKEGSRTIKRSVEYFNLDAVLSVGYRVNSKRGTQFRIWATNVLRKYLADGYVLNKKRLENQADKIKELQIAINLLKNVAALENISNETRGVIEVIAEYTRALHILDDYDHEKLTFPKGTKRNLSILSYEEAKKIIIAMKNKYHDSKLVGLEKDHSFKSSIGAIYQTFGGKDVYPTIEEKAAHLLYFVTKNHSFVDGNKRIAAALFICFLHKNKILLKKDGSKRLDDNALAALTLMVAASKPAEKNIMIKVILNLIA
jgi:prophage maintenance system killer protein